jgi:GNAT superfamily N-acetyltransferase
VCQQKTLGGLALDSYSEVCLSAIDEERFGIRTARAPEVTQQLLPSVIEFCRNNAVKLLIARCPVSELPTAQAMERQGFELMDTLVYYTRDLVKPHIPSDIGKATIRRVRPGEEEKVKAIAAECFRGYSGHYHADQRLDRTQCDEVYVSWAFRSCVSRDAADNVLIAELHGSVVAFCALRVNSPGEGEVVLNGVTPSAQGQGVYRSLMIHGMQWCLSEGLSRMLISTQITNLAVQRVWTRLGFELSHAYYTFHKWFN